MKIRIKKDRAIVFLLVFGLLNLPSCDYMGEVVSVLNNALRVVSALGAGYFALKKKAAKFTPLFCLLVFMEFELLVSTLINGTDIWGCIMRACSIIALMLVFEACSHNIKDLVFALMPLVELLCYANYITVLLFPDGMYSTYSGPGIWFDTRNWLLGHKNLFIVYLVPGYLIAFLYRKYGGKWWRELALYIVGFISVALPPVQSGTSTMGLFTLLLLLCVIRSGVKFNAYLLVGVNVAAYLAIVVFRLQYYFSWLIVSILGKDLTLSNRTGIWDAVIALVEEKPLLGFGTLTREESVALTGFIGGSHAHNLVLHCLFEGGVIQLALYLCMMVVIYRRLRREQNRMTTQAIIVTLFVFQIMALMENYQAHPFLYLLYYFAYFAEQISTTAKVQAGSGMPHGADKRELRLYHTLAQRSECNE